jgi:hypothetical protein
MAHSAYSRRIMRFFLLMIVLTMHILTDRTQSSNA